MPLIEAMFAGSRLLKPVFFYLKLHSQYFRREKLIENILYNSTTDPEDLIDMRKVYLLLVLLMV